MKKFNDKINKTIIFSAYIKCGTGVSADYLVCIDNMWYYLNKF